MAPAVRLRRIRRLVGERASRLGELSRAAVQITHGYGDGRGHPSMVVLGAVR